MKTSKGSKWVQLGEATTTVIGLAEQISQKTSGFIHSSNHRDLLDIVDALRSNGVSHHVDLPQIIVCGSQSSGKSSTLESLSGITFPTAEGLYTRFATELILRRSEKSEVKVQISLLPVEMGLTGTGPDAKVFSTDVLRIESTSPTAPDLTLVDLPGLFSASDKDQTLGLITKPDKIDRGSDTEKYYTFFAESDWGQALDPSQLGVAALRDRLRKVLWKQISESLPGVESDVQKGIKDCAAKLYQLGKSRSTMKEKHKYLHGISSQLSTMIQAGIDGV
ncbi:hypothetical protein IFR04_002335 [Cadophora malorum]|uniref:Dynamin GTPase domain-containing protein n=1 Tax=Cadophora malorum TaxID=108018 RepID=A0A8H7WGN0_9HELO|nr:hypothetical protein IFR04_002335 [Cadophora malorum]